MKTLLASELEKRMTIDRSLREAAVANQNHLLRMSERRVKSEHKHKHENKKLLESLERRKQSE